MPKGKNDTVFGCGTTKRWNRFSSIFSIGPSTGTKIFSGKWGAKKKKLSLRQRIRYLKSLQR